VRTIISAAVEVRAVCTGSATVQHAGVSLNLVDVAFSV